MSSWTLNSTIPYLRILCCVIKSYTVVVCKLLVVLYTALIILREVINLNCTNVIVLLVLPNTILLTELSVYGLWNSLQDTVVTVCYLFVVSWLNSIRVVFVLIFNFRFFFSYIYFFCIIAIVLTVFFVYFIGVSGLRVLPLSINGWISSLIHHLFIYCIKYR